MNAQTILGLDIGGANLKLSTPDGIARSVSFALWKEPHNLPIRLVELFAEFPQAERFAVTMTGELCDCFPTKRDGVRAILEAVSHAAGSRPVAVWSVDGCFISADEANVQPIKVAAANWHATATFVGRRFEVESGLLLDIGSTTADIIPILNRRPTNSGATDVTRLATQELVYTGTRRTPVYHYAGPHVAAELFATIHDAYLVLGEMPEDPTDIDTADGRAMTLPLAHARLCRMLCGDADDFSVEQIRAFAQRIVNAQFEHLEGAFARQVALLKNTEIQGENVSRMLVLAGSGEFLARKVSTPWATEFGRVESFSTRFGEAVAAAAPAFAVACLLAESLS